MLVRHKKKSVCHYKKTMKKVLQTSKDNLLEHVASRLDRAPLLRVHVELSKDEFCLGLVLLELHLDL